MKRLFLAVMAMGIIISGCAKKDTIKPVDQSRLDRTIEEQAGKNQSGKKESLPVENVTSLDTAEADKALDGAIKELQRKLKDIHFDFDKYAVRSEDKPILKEVANVLQQNKNIKVIIEGHCDEKGTNEYNLALGDKRASVTKEYLMSLAIPSVKLDTISYGEERPLCRESTEECWAMNRRAHFALIRAGK